MVGYYPSAGCFFTFLLVGWVGGWLLLLLMMIMLMLLLLLMVLMVLPPMLPMPMLLRRCRVLLLVLLPLTVVLSSAVPRFLQAFCLFQLISESVGGMWAAVCGNSTYAILVGTREGRAQGVAVPAQPH